MQGAGVAEAITPSSPTYSNVQSANSPTTPAAAEIRVYEPAAGSARTAPCPCGSSLRYKHCCGKLDKPALAAAAADPNIEFQFNDAIVRHAGALFSSGEANRAAELLANLKPTDVHNAKTALDAGDLFMDMHLLDPARALLKRAVELSGGHSSVIAAYDECCHLIERASVWESASRNLRLLLDRLKARAHPRKASADPRIHIVCKLDTIGGTERRALNLHRCLAAHAAVTLWSAEKALSVHSTATPIRQITENDTPAGGILVLVGTYFVCGDWLKTAAFDRIVICHNLAEQYKSLSERLIQIEKNPSCPEVELTFPSRLFQQVVRLEGSVEYSSVDVEVFRPRTTHVTRPSGLIIGRHGRAHPLKFHPNDPSFFRALMARGHKIRILGGGAIAPAFARNTGPSPELLAVGEVPAEDFLAGLDVFVYRKHPELFETGGTTIVEAMATALPVIVFPEQCGMAELIEHGKNGFIVNSEVQAIELIDRLSADPALRERIGRSARDSIVELMRQQTAATISYYLKRPADTTS